MNSYLMEKLVAMRLAEARADAARHRALAALNGPESRAGVAIKSALLRGARWIGRRGAVSPRHA